MSPCLLCQADYGSTLFKWIVTVLAHALDFVGFDALTKLCFPQLLSMRQISKQSNQSYRICSYTVSYGRYACLKQCCQDVALTQLWMLFDINNPTFQRSFLVWPGLDVCFNISRYYKSSRSFK